MVAPLRQAPKDGGRVFSGFWKKLFDQLQYPRRDVLLYPEEVWLEFVSFGFYVYRAEVFSPDNILFQRIPTPIWVFYWFPLRYNVYNSKKYTWSMMLTIFALWNSKPYNRFEIVSSVQWKHRGNGIYCNFTTSAKWCLFIVVYSTKCVSSCRSRSSNSKFKQKHTNNLSHSMNIRSQLIPIDIIHYLLTSKHKSFCIANKTRGSSPLLWRKMT